MSNQKKKPPKIPAAHSARAQRRLLKSGHARAASKALLKAYIDMKSSDWPAYVAEFFDTWQTNEEGVKEFAEKLLQNPRLSFEPQTWADLFLPLEPGMLTLFVRLFGRLSYAETERFIELTVSLSADWRMLCGVLVMKGYCSQTAADYLLEGVGIALNLASDFVLGVTEPVISGGYCQVVNRLCGYHATLMGGVES